MLSMTLVALIAAVLFCITAGGGDLEPPSPPGSTMYSLDELYSLSSSVGLGQMIPLKEVKPRGKVYMQMSGEGMQGESTDPCHVDWIDTLWVGFKMYQPANTDISTSGARLAERIYVSNMNLVKEIDQSSPKLYLACCRGTSIDNIKIEFCRAVGDEQVYMKYELKNAVITAIAPVASHRTCGLFTHLEEISIQFARITWTYYKEGGGQVNATWDVVGNKGS